MLRFIRESTNSTSCDVGLYDGISAMYFSCCPPPICVHCVQIILYHYKIRLLFGHFELNFCNYNIKIQALIVYNYLSK